jgi:hypothetical protein
MTGDVRRLHRDQRGLVGKFIVGWLLIVGLIGLAAVDFTSIAFTTFRLSDIAASAASEAASQFNRGANSTRACEAADRSVTKQDPTVRMVGCRRIDTASFSITVRKQASTLVVSKVDFLDDYGRVTRTETVGPSAV